MIHIFLILFLFRIVQIIIITDAHDFWPDRARELCSDMGAADFFIVDS